MNESITQVVFKSMPYDQDVTIASLIKQHSEFDGPAISKALYRTNKQGCTKTIRPGVFRRIRKHRRTRTVIRKNAIPELTVKPSALSEIRDQLLDLAGRVEEIENGH